MAAVEAAERELEAARSALSGMEGRLTRARERVGELKRQAAGTLAAVKADELEAVAERQAAAEVDAKAAELVAAELERRVVTERAKVKEMERRVAVAKAEGIQAEIDRESLAIVNEAMRPLLERIMSLRQLHEAHAALGISAWVWLPVGRLEEDLSHVAAVFDSEWRSRHAGK